MENVEQTKQDDRIASLEKKIDFLVKEAERAALSRKIALILGIIVFLLPLVSILLLLPTIMDGISTFSSLSI